MCVMYSGINYVEYVFFVNSDSGDGCATIGAAEVTGNSDNHLVLTLPPFPEAGTKYNTGNAVKTFFFCQKSNNIFTAYFYQRCVKCITDSMKEVPHSVHPTANSSQVKDQSYQHTLQASCLLLRGLYYIASGCLLEGLADLHETAKEDYRIFPLR